MQPSGTNPYFDPSSPPWWIRDLVLAAGFLTRISFPAINPGDRQLLRTGWCFPVVGAIVGALGALLACIAQSLGIPEFACALLALAGTALLTGALHEDGLADLSDGFGGGVDKPAKIAIMRDSRIGAYGVLSLILVSGLKASAIAAFLGAGDTASVFLAMVVAHAGARGLMVPVALWLPNASDEGLAKMAGSPKRSTAQIALTISAALLLLFCPFFTAMAAGVVACAAAGIVAGLARRQIGGYTGDVLGAVEQTAETAILLALAASIGT
jgi:adenosylcobinamide-GDP ribazoletransferase